MTQTTTRAWMAEELDRDRSWAHRLSPAAAEGVNAALTHARALNKPLLAMTPADFPLNEAASAALKSAVAATQTGFGFCLLKGFPVERWNESDARMACWGLGLHMGVGRTQNRASEIINHVRDEGGSYKVKNGRGYNTNAGLDFHVDSCDVVALLCLQTAKSGGTSKITSSMALCDEIARQQPEMIDVLREPFYYSYQGANDPAQPPFYSCPILGDDPAHFAFRTNRKNMTAAQRDFDEVPRMSAAQVAALDLLDVLQPDPRFCYSMELDRGDLQLVNNYAVIHSRTDFEDFPEPERRRHLLRLWLALPQSQPLPAQWESYFGDRRAGAVRGGVRGSSITREFLDYEERQARLLGMTYRRPVTTSVESDATQEAALSR